MRTITQNQAHPQKQASPALARSNMATHKSNQRGNPLPQLQRTLGNQAMQRMLQTHDEEPNAGLIAAVSPRVGHDCSQILKYPHAPEAIQTKLAISKPGDEYEQEADRVAEQVMRMPVPQPQPQRTAANGKQDEVNEEGLVQRKASEPLLQRKCACGSNASALTGKCEECGMKRMLGLQTKLAISEPGDRYEQEADRVADQVMRMPEPQLQRAVATSKQDEENEEGLVQRKTTNVAPASSPPGLNHVQSNLGSGQPLDAGTRSFFEPRFGRDFGNVRIYSGPQAAAAAASIQARAFTLGRNVVFAAGEHDPGSESGKRLLAHELTHVVQQSARPATIIARDPSDMSGDSVSLVAIDCSANTITFTTSTGSFSYNMTVCNVTPGDYEANVTAEPGNVFFDLGESASESVNFTFSYDISPGQANPSTFFGDQRTVRISVLSPTGFGAGVSEIPIEFFGTPVSLESAPLDISLPRDSVAAAADTSTHGMPGYPLSTTGMGLHVLASGDLSWLTPSAASRRVLSPEYWSPLVPGRGYTTLDRLTNTLPRNLAPRIADELASGQPLSWVVRRGFTEAELRSIPELVSRLSRTGVGSLTPAELTMLQRAAALHIGGSTPGAPFASFTVPGHTPPFLGASPPAFRVRMEIPSTAALDVSTPNAFNLGREALTNIEEAEFLVVANREGRIVSVERIGGSPEPGFLMRHSRAIRWGGRLLIVAGVAYSAYRVAEAAPEDRRIIAAEETGGHLGGFAGTALAVAGCVAFGVATSGVGLLLCGLGGGIAGGALGSGFAGAMARDVGDSPDSGTRGTCPSCHALQREWEYDRLGARFQGLQFDSSSLPLDAVPISPTPGESGAAVLSSDEIEMIRHWLETAGPAAVE